MKFPRTLPRLLAPLLVFALMLTTAQTNVLQKKKVDEPIPCFPITTYGKVVTIFLHGLMVGRYKNGNATEQRFEVGVVKRAPNHTFAFNVYADKKPCNTECEYAKKLRDGGSWTFEILPISSNVAIGHNITMYRLNAEGSRKECPNSLTEQEAEASEYILNIEGKKLHDDRNIARYKRPFKPVFFFHNGEVRTHCLTDCLKAQIVEKDEASPPIAIDRIAEVVKVVIRIPENHRLVLQNKDEVVWQNIHENPIVHKEDADVEGRVLNLAPDSIYEEAICNAKFRCEAVNNSHHSKAISSSNGPSISGTGQPEDEEATDFQLYYHLVFRKDRPDRFELINPKCPGSLNVVDTQGQGTRRTVPPYRCGMVLVQEGSDKINFKPQK